MIRDKQAAKIVSDLMIEYGAKLDGSVKVVKDRCPPQEFESYRRAVGQIMGYMLLEVMNPLYSEHPELKPEGLE